VNLRLALRLRPGRGFARAFGRGQMSDDTIERVVRYLWTFCDDPSWPRGDLNLPRAFFTEKAFPENEAVWTTGVTTSGTKAVANEIVYEHRIGSRWQYEVKVPFDAQQTAPEGLWSRGLGDVESPPSARCTPVLTAAASSRRVGQSCCRRARRRSVSATGTPVTSRSRCGVRSSVRAGLPTCMSGTNSRRIARSIRTKVSLAARSATR
jgi:hypothetical protein